MKHRRIIRTPNDTNDKTRIWMWNVVDEDREMVLEDRETKSIEFFATVDSFPHDITQSS